MTNLFNIFSISIICLISGGLLIESIPPITTIKNKISTQNIKYLTLNFFIWATHKILMGVNILFFLILSIFLFQKFELNNFFNHGSISSWMIGILYVFVLVFILGHACFFLCLGIGLAQNTGNLKLQKTEVNECYKIIQKEKKLIKAVLIKNNKSKLNIL